MKSVLNFFAERKFNNLDCINMLGAVILVPIIGWWVVPAYILGTIVSVIAEHLNGQYK